MVGSVAAREHQQFGLTFGGPQRLSGINSHGVNVRA